jgi:hypothetical protein
LKSVHIERYSDWKYMEFSFWIIISGRFKKNEIE